MRSGALSQLSALEIDRRRAEILNRQRGNLEGYDCQQCLNRGYFVHVDDDGGRRSVECKCMDTRRSMDAIKRSGLSSLLERYTYEKWQANERWQKRALELAKSYAAKPGGSWFMMTGRPGSGKTHLCTALCADLMRNGKRVKYMLWRDVSVQAKAVVNDEEEYRRIVDPLKTVPVLYIDDLFKAGKDEKGNVKVTPGDINLAFEIINFRYNDSRKLTIISSERSVGDMLSLDEAVGSRIYERTRDFYIPLDGAKNWRME
ncbi:MAG: ATP-binding protein [Clostridia bacterium]|nr:ATP-binding protein [Clostridia bacterium]